MTLRTLTIDVRVSPPELARYKRLAASEGCSLSETVRRALAILEERRASGEALNAAVARAGTRGGDGAR